MNFSSYGYEFLWETYLYHVVRKDHRHNFSAYFYQIYLSTAIETDSSSSVIALLAFIPQIILLIAIAYYYHKTIGFCIFLQTLTFVIFNKVCTVQVCFLPNYIHIFVTYINCIVVFYLVFFVITASISMYEIFII